MEEISNFTTPVPSPFSAYGFWHKGVVEMCLFVFSFLSGIPTHAYVIYLIVTGKGNGIASEIFILNLSVCEILFSVNSLFNALAETFQSLIIFTWFLIGEIITGHPMFQCLMCVERYLAVVHPVIFLKFKPLRYRVICCTAAWMIGFGSGLFCMFLLMSPNFYLYVWFYTVQFLIFLSTQLFCLLAVLRALKQSGPGERGREREEENHIKKRAFHLILIATVSMIIRYAPYIITGFFIVTLQDDESIQVLWSVSYVCFMLAGFVQPVLYLHRMGKLSCFCF
ncbi:C-C chemokine receptor type 8-like [Triplophysa dalaica]|uniref:C-C chemokine receptor type 8-like n=1 Tax=Triplophysa dalaica TaxID=1582913 RepID=UPI0024E00EC1|nr:C-C chemokine receptor type 8-like [Triplophysa dalaica]